LRRFEWNGSAQPVSAAAQGRTKPKAMDITDKEGHTLRGVPAGSVDKSWPGYMGAAPHELQPLAANYIRGGPHVSVHARYRMRSENRQDHRDDAGGTVTSRSAFAVHR
jgi:hypothetical protein